MRHPAPAARLPLRHAAPGGSVNSESLTHFHSVTLHQVGHSTARHSLTSTALTHFHCATLHQESVCACFGAGFPAACVVDLGDQCTKISCVEEGISLPGTQIYLPYGGDDVTQTLAWLLRHSPSHYLPLSVEEQAARPAEAHALLAAIKEAHCRCRDSAEENFQVGPSTASPSVNSVAINQSHGGELPGGSITHLGVNHPSGVNHQGGRLPGARPGARLRE